MEKEEKQKGNLEAEDAKDNKLNLLAGNFELYNNDVKKYYLSEL